MSKESLRYLVQKPLNNRLGNPVSNYTNLNPTEELPIGGILVDSGKRYMVTEAHKAGSCKGCDLYNGFCCDKTKKSRCVAYTRSDKTWVIFKKVK